MPCLPEFIVRMIGQMGHKYRKKTKYAHIWKTRGVSKTEHSLLSGDAVTDNPIWKHLFSNLPVFSLVLGTSMLGVSFFAEFFYSLFYSSFGIYQHLMMNDRIIKNLLFSKWNFNNWQIVIDRGGNCQFKLTGSHIIENKSSIISIRNK